MEFLAKFKCTDESRVNYIYLDRSKKLVGFSLDGNGIKPFQKELISRFLDSLYINDKCIELLEWDADGYDVYYDYSTKFKHYIKDGKEDFKKFFINNGFVAFDYRLDYIDYDDEEESEYEEEKSNIAVLGVVKKFLSVGLVAVISFSALNMLVSHGDEILDSLLSYSSDFDVDEGLAVFDGEMISVDDAIKLINDSLYLTDEYKDFLANKDLFDDIMPYYKGTYMQEEIKVKLDQIKFLYFDRADSHYYDGLGGYYNCLNPSVINVFEEHKNNQDVHRAVVAHEFIHLLQSNYSTYNYLTEATAELIAEEYFDSTVDTAYEEGVNSLKLLIEMVGIDPILKGVFGGDYTDLENILLDNLASDDFKKIIEYMGKSPSDVINQEEDIRRIFRNLYKNMYDQDIHDDENILYDILYKNGMKSIVSTNSDRIYYFNRSKMQDRENIIVDIDDLFNSVGINGILTKEEKYLVSRDLDLDEYIQYMGNDSVQLKYDSVYANGLKIGDEYIIYEYVTADDNGGMQYNNPVQTMSLLEAVENNYLRVKLYGEVQNNSLDDSLPDEWNYELDLYGKKIVTDVYYGCNIDNAYIDDEQLIISRSGIKDRFDINSNTNSIGKY